MGLDDELGSIAVGKRADVVLLNADPLKDVEPLVNPALVIQDGKIVCYEPGG